MLEDRINKYDNYYESATIYKISVGDNCYYGSSKDYKNRILNHKCLIRNNNKNNKLYKFIRENKYNLDDIAFTIVKQLTNVSKNELDLIENEYISSVSKEKCLNERKSCIMVSRPTYYRNWNELVNCECGKRLRRGELGKHRKRDIHKKRMEELD